MAAGMLGRESALETDRRFMEEAVREARKAFEQDETPIGSVIVHKDKIVGRAHNQVELLQDATAHAEMIALTQAASAAGDWRLSGTTLYVTKEPCLMCYGAVLQARVGRIVYGAPEVRDIGMTKIARTWSGIAVKQPEVTGGVCEEECRELLQAFFRKARRKDSE